MASRYYQRPENAISKAEEFIKVGKPTRALDTLYDVIKSKSKRHTFSEKLIEQIMFKYLELCVDLKKSHVAKEGLFQYRNMCQATNVASLASVVQGYLNMAEKRTDTAKQESQDSVQEVDDLENLATPEMIMLSAVSGEDAQDRSDRKILMPWVKFLWESYCQCLELLRTNVRVERLYHDIAQQAFRFCLKYQRKTEFRKLCDKLRNHLDLILKQTPSPVTINLNHAETQQMNLDTRLVQLDAAIQMELWQEAYKAVEDIHGLMTLSKKVFQPKMMANYFQKVALVFWKCGNYLFHAAALSKHFQLTREMKKNLSPEELGKMASRVLIACLAVPVPSQHPEFDKFIETDRTPQEKMARLAILLGLQQPPTRQSLLRDASRFGVVQAATSQIQDLYQSLEVDFHPLKLCRRIEKNIKFIEGTDDLANLVQYIPALKEVTLVRLLKQVSQVYQSICFQRLLELAPFTDSFTLERIIVDCVRHNDMQIRVDHRSRTVHFGTDLAEAQSYDLAEGPHLQDMPSEQIRTQLMQMLEVLDKSLKTILPDKLKDENHHLRQKIVEAYHQSKQRDHQRILGRHKIIEERKEYLEKLSIHREAEEQRKAELQLRERQKQEDERLKAEIALREKLQAEIKMKKAQQDSVKAKLIQIGQTDIGKKILEDLDEKDIAELDTEKIMAKQVEELEKEKRELMARLKAQEKKVDHMERAKRREEIPLLKEAFEKDKEDDKVFWSSKEKERIKQAIVDREIAVITRDRMKRMREDKDAYLSDLLKQRKHAFDKKLKEFNDKVDRERVVRLKDRKHQRMVDRRQKWIHEKEEEEQRLRDEELKREREEQAKLEADRKAKEEEEYRKNKEKLDAIAAKQKEREREVEERLQKEREEARGKPREVRDDWRREKEEGGGSWRRDRDEKEPARAGIKQDDGERLRVARRDNDGEREGGRGGRHEETERDGGTWKSGGAGSWRDRERRKDEEWGPRKPEDDGVDRGQRRDDRPAPRRDNDRPPPRRDDDRPPPRRDDDRAPLKRDDRAPPRRDDDRAPPRRDDDRGFGRRDDDRGLGRRDDDRGLGRRDDDRRRNVDDRDDWRRGGPRKEEDRGHAQRDVGPSDWRRKDEREGGGPPRRGGGAERSERPQRAGGRDEDDNWRAGPPKRDVDVRREDKKGPPMQAPQGDERREDDGWTKVKR